jgi:cell division transport system ATP-binding protein
MRRPARRKRSAPSTRRTLGQGGVLTVVPALERERILHLDSVSYGYPRSLPVLQEISMTVTEGQFVCITGESGAGKSTLFKLVYGALRANRGSIWVDGENLSAASSRRLLRIRRRLGFVFQEYRLLPQLTALENLCFAMQVTNIWMRYADVQRRALEVLTDVGLLDKKESRPRELSGGQQQRLAVARALVNRPRLLLADEPTGNLDDANVHRILALFEQIAAGGTAVLVATHDERLIGNRREVLRLEHGRLVRCSERGDPARIEA